MVDEGMAVAGSDCCRGGVAMAVWQRRGLRAVAVHGQGRTTTTNGRWLRARRRLGKLLRQGRWGYGGRGATAGRKKGWATASSNSGREGQWRSRREDNEDGWATGGRGLETTIMAEGVMAGCSLQSHDEEEKGGSRRGLPQGRRAAGDCWGRRRCGWATVSNNDRAMAEGWRGRRQWRQRERALDSASGWRAARVAADVAAGGEEWLAAAIEEESKAAVKVGWKRLDSDRGRRGRQQREGRAGSGCVAVMRAVSDGFTWSRKDSDGRQEEAAGALMFGVAAAVREMGI
ncbi:hypothetical protein BHM03_00050333 [Ensete ventricosum]|nr:hypothetical protein BHM03_00050333 [Ensete ventricosum]